mmetsp:Transcript_13319/g.35721  ORF Transcript_13319/g.35721 Transcript_13319/m.35721 type:complete len:567 (+) Transcript_13319:218-1918(+)
MAGTMQELVPTAPTQQLQMPAAFDEQQMQHMQQMSAMMAMAASAQVFSQYLQQYAGVGDPMTSPAVLPPVPAPYAPPQMAPATPPSIVSVSVEGMKVQYQLTDDDLHKVFSRYGTVSQIRVHEAGTTALIAFEQAQHAQAAMSDLDGKVLNGLDGTLRISWANCDSGFAGCAAAANGFVGGGAAATAIGNAVTAGAGVGAAPVPPYPVMPPPFPGWCFPHSATPAWTTTMAPPPVAPPSVPPADLGALAALAPPPPLPGASAAASAVVASATSPASSPLVPAGGVDGGAPPAMSAKNGSGDAKSPPHVKGVRKYTCRFMIGIENDKEFSVVRRIIGTKGAHMKRIFKQTDAKLRLRGRGSGYFEGASQKESNEPLQLCVSCTSNEGYKLAVSLTEELLESVYAEYRAFCAEQGKPEPELHTSPQVVSGRDRDRDRQSDGSGGNSVGQTALPLVEEGVPGGDEGDDDDVGVSKKEGGRRRGRRSRGGKAKSSDGKGAADRSDPPPKAPPVEEIEQFIDQRNEARRQCNFVEADQIRTTLYERGVALMDEPGARGRGTEVTTWRYWRE